MRVRRLVQMDSKVTDRGVCNYTAIIRKRMFEVNLDMFKGSPLRLPTPLSDQFPVRVCSYPHRI